MWATNLKVGTVVIGTVAFYTMLANSIPQIESDVPTELAFTGAVTAEQLVQAGDQLYHGAGGCVACHGLGTRAPNLLSDEQGAGMIGARCATRVAAQDCKTYLHESMINPGAFVVPGYQPIMPDMSRTLSPTQVWALVAYLESQGGTVTVSAEDLPAEGADAAGRVTPATDGATAGGAAGGTPAAGAAPATASLDPKELMRANQCTLCHIIDGEGGAIGPALDDVASRLDTDAIRRSILQPNADTASGYEALAGTVPATFGAQLTAAQLEVLVGYLGGRQ